MTCNQLFYESLQHQANAKMKCPIRVFPHCHPKSRIDVFVDGRKRIVTLVCAQCDTTLSTIKVGRLRVDS